MGIFIINGVDPDVSVLSLQREATILNGENAGRLKNGNIVRDVTGTIYNYAFEVVPRLGNLAAYDSLYETITAPVDSYPITVPFGQGDLQFDAYVENVTDELWHMNSEKKLWDKMAFTATAKEPQRYFGGNWSIGSGSGNQVFTVDGVGFNVSVTKLERTSKLLDTDRSGRLKSGTVHREIIGTYYNYTMELEQALNNVDEYDQLYYALTAPVNSHPLVVPYGQSTLSFQAYVTKVNDNLTFSDGRLRRWGGMEVDFTAMSPARR